MDKKELEIVLSHLKAFSSPWPQLEQYHTPSSVAAKLLHFAFMQGDIGGKAVADLGCGTGILAIGAALLGASKVYGVDSDPEALTTAKENERMLFQPGPKDTGPQGSKGTRLPVSKDTGPQGPQPDITWLQSDIGSFSTQVDTVVQNPPFGIQKEHADRPFLEKALSIADTVYSIHHSNPGTRKFINTFVESIESKSYFLSTESFELPKTMKHHKKELERINVDLYKIVKRESTKRK